jgi:hypothetical protein
MICDPDCDCELQQCLSVPDAEGGLGRSFCACQIHSNSLSVTVAVKLTKLF